MTKDRVCANDPVLPAKPHSEENPYHMATYLYALTQVASQLTDQLECAPKGLSGLMTVIEERADVLMNVLDARAFCENWPELERRLRQSGSLDLKTSFLAPIAGKPDMLALCYPKTKIDYACCYMLSDGTTIYADGKRWMDGSAEGWRKILPGQFDGRVIGSVISVYLKNRLGWHQAGIPFVAG